MTITINLNGESHEIAEGTSLSALVDKLQKDLPDGENGPIATAVNEEFVASSQREHFILKNGDSVMTFSPITGG